jgi:hypothetical protein
MRITTIRGRLIDNEMLCWTTWMIRIRTLSLPTLQAHLLLTHPPDLPSTPTRSSLFIPSNNNNPPTSSSTQAPRRHRLKSDRIRSNLTYSQATSTTTITTNLNPQAYPFPVNYLQLHPRLPRDTLHTDKEEEQQNLGKRYSSCFMVEIELRALAVEQARMERE